MNKRQKEVQQQFLDNEKKVLKKLEGNYQDALDEINSKIELLMARQDADMQHVIYQVEYQKALKTQVQSILETLQANEFETVSEYLANAYHDGFIGTMYDMQGQGIPLIFPIDQEQVVAAVQHETKLSENLYTALGKDITDLRKKISGEISRGLSSGQMYGEITRNIESWARIPKNNAARIARTEAHRIQCKATADAQFKAKEKGADVVKQWDASLDGSTRSSHRKLDGQVRELEEQFEVNGHKAMQPGGFGRPEEDINCRCALLQRARWALGNDYTKWSPDAPIEISDDGTTQFAIIDAKSFKEFKGFYMDATRQMTMNFENENLSRVRSNVQKKNKKVVAKKEESAKLELTEDEADAITRYVSSDSYKINAKLRSDAKLDEFFTAFRDNLDSGLAKMKRYEGNLVRDLTFRNSASGKKTMKKFLSQFEVGSEVNFREYISTTKANAYSDKANVRIYIWNSKNGRDISYFNEKEQEVLYERDSAFKVLDKWEADGMTYIRLEEK